MYASDAAASDNFGISVSLYGDTALIGAINGDDDSNNKADSGSVYVFTRSSSDGTFTQQSKIHAEGDAAVSDEFGRSVSLYGDTALIGAKIDDSVISIVYVFTRPNADGTFTEQDTLNATDAKTNDNFGISVSLYGDTALIGTNFDDDVGSNSGSVYVFTRPSSDGTFTQRYKLHAHDKMPNDNFGTSVSLYGDTALIGATKDDPPSNSGSVYVFTRSGPDGTFEKYEEQPKLHANDPESGDYFGSSVSLHGDTALIGAIGVDDDVRDLNDVGSVYVFTRSSTDGGTFTQQSKLHASDAAASDHFGISVSLYGDTALIGAFGDDDNSKSMSGSVYVFTRSSTDDGTFTQQSKLHASDAAKGDYFGISVSLYGDTALIGARYDDDNSKSNSGSVYVFKAP